MATIPRERFQRAFELRQWLDVHVKDADEPGEGQKKFEEAVLKAAGMLQPLVGRALAENWARSGLGHGDSAESHIGKALRNVLVQAVIRGKKVELRYYMDPKAAPYEMKSYVSPHGNGRKAPGSKKVVSAFKVAGALHYGAVRMQKQLREVYDVHGAATGKRFMAPVGTKAKKTIKKIAEGTASKRAQEALASGYVRKGIRLTDPFDIGRVEHARQTKMLGTSVHFSSQAVVIPGRPFFDLTLRQRSAIGQKFVETLQQELGGGGL
jgi:hypothetical protein